MKERKSLNAMRCVDLRKVTFMSLLFLVICCLVYAEPIESIQILKISGRDERAVIKTPDGSMQIIRVGDAFGGRGKVTEIADGRVVVEERTDQGTETVIIRVENGKQRIERVKKVGDKQPTPYAPK